MKGLYIVYSQSLPKVCKVGYSEDVQKALDDLNANSDVLPTPMYVKTIWVDVDEQVMEDLLQDVASRTEKLPNDFYAMTADEMNDCFVEWAAKLGDERNVHHYIPMIH